MIALVFVLLVSNPQVTTSTSPPDAPNNPSARVNGDPPVPTPVPCPVLSAPMASGSGSPALANAGTMAMSSGDCAGTLGGVVTGNSGPPNPPSNWGPRRVVATPSTPTASASVDSPQVEAIRAATTGSSVTPSESARTQDKPRRFLSRRQWGWVGAVVSAVVVGAIVTDHDGGSSPVGPDGR